MFWLIVFSPVIVYFSIVGLSELGILGASQKTFLALYGSVWVAGLQAVFFFGGVIYEVIFRRKHLQRVPRYMYYIILAAMLGILAVTFLL